MPPVCCGAAAAAAAARGPADCGDWVLSPSHSAQDGERRRRQRGGGGGGGGRLREAFGGCAPVAVNVPPVARLFSDAFAVAQSPLVRSSEKKKSSVRCLPKEQFATTLNNARLVIRVKSALEAFT